MGNERFDIDNWTDYISENKLEYHVPNYRFERLCTEAELLEVENNQLEAKCAALCRNSEANVERVVKLEDCVILIQSILSGAEFTVETANEAALVKAMEIARFPITVDKNTLDSDFHYEGHKTFINELIDTNTKQNSLIKAITNIPVLDNSCVECGAEENVCLCCLE